MATFQDSYNHNPQAIMTCFGLQVTAKLEKSSMGAAEDDDFSTGWTVSDDDMSTTDSYSDDSSSSNNSDWIDAEEEFSNNIRFFHKSVSSPALIALNVSLHPPLVNQDELRRQQMMRVVSASAVPIGLPLALMERMVKAELVIGDSLSKLLTTSQTKNTAANQAPQTQDHELTDLYSALLEKRGMSAASVPALGLSGFFLEMKEDNIAGYDIQKTAAIRTEDINALRRMLNQGRTLQVCNQFGESVVHAVCRRSSPSVLHFLVHEAQVSVRVVDDYGRTPMHDACWTNEPNFDVVKILLEACPDLLLIADKRGFTPLAYVRKDLWSEWGHFLEVNEDLLMPRVLAQMSS